MRYFYLLASVVLLALAGSVCQAGPMVVLSTTAPDLNQVKVGDTIQLDVTVTSLNSGDSLDFLGVDLSFPGSLFGPLPTVTPGLVPGGKEGPHDEKRTDGIDALVTSLMANGIKPGANVYAELGSTWRLLMRDPDSAAHGLGKLLKHCGESNVLWGTDSVWYGPPQALIDAFRRFTIPPSMQDEFGYPALTPSMKEAILGRNAVQLYGIDAVAPRDDLSWWRDARDELARRLP